MGNYPWLADSWPTSNLVHGGKEAGNCCTTSHDTTERYYNGLSALVTRVISSEECVPLNNIRILCRRRYLQLPEPDREIQHGRLH